jgi:tagaturonate reductase
MLKELNRSTAETKSFPFKVLQFGEGNFLRGFADWIIDIMNEKAGFNGSIQIVQPRAHGAHKGEVVNRQDGLFHVVVNGIRRGENVRETRLITSVTGVINPYANYQAFLQTGESDTLQFILSNTTEAGIAFNEGDNDAQRVPESFPGKVTALLYHRFNFFKGSSDKGLTVIPCELIEKNGEALRDMVLRYIQHWKLSEAFKQWVLQHNTFCNTLVDRIVPGYPTDTIAAVEKETGYHDKLVVMAEPFYVWVIEAPDTVKKKFPAEAAGLNVKFVSDLTPYRTQKVRILNGAHTAMVPVAYLKGIRTVREAMEDPATSAFIQQTIQEEIIPGLRLPDEDLHQFAQDVLDRFRNPYIRHELQSIALNSISKFKVRVLPSLLAFWQMKKALPTNLVHSLAALIRFYQGEWRSEKLPINDSAEVMEFFTSAWASGDIHFVVKEALGNVNFWGQDLNAVEGLSAQVVKNIKDLNLIEQKEK